MTPGIYETFRLVTESFAALTFLAFLGGLATCWIHRRLSGWLILVALGFAMKCGSLGLTQLLSWRFRSEPAGQFSLTYGFLGAALLDVIAAFLLIGGLWFSLVDLHRKLSRSLETSHGKS